MHSNRTRIKFCGLTRPLDVRAACRIGVDAVGFICFEGSSRFVAPEGLAALAAEVAPFVTPVLLFVDAPAAHVERCIAEVPGALLQFHGRETAGECARWARPWIKAVAMGEGVDLLECEFAFAGARALLADAPVAGHGGSGVRFEWARLPAPGRRTRPLVLAGGLDATNVGEAIGMVAPDAVDVSSGIESAKGIKSVERMQEFFEAVRAADQQASPENRNPPG
jgi:phosphoribosylanthranilate isomerase